MSDREVCPLRVSNYARSQCSAHHNASSQHESLVQLDNTNPVIKAWQCLEHSTYIHERGCVWNHAEGALSARRFSDPTKNSRYRSSGDCAKQQG
jgi:hypothetical protein